MPEDPADEPRDAFRRAFEDQVRASQSQPALRQALSDDVRQLDIGRPVIVQPGSYLPHGQVVVDGPVVIGPRAVLRPWIAIGLVEGEIVGPTLGSEFSVAAGAKLLGSVGIGSNRRIGANALFRCDVPDGATGIGLPARALDASVARGARPPAGEVGRAAAARLQTKEGSM